MKSTPSQLENLEKGVPFTPESAAKVAKEGQKKSVEARKQNIAMEKFASVIASNQVSDSELRQALTELGITAPDMQNNALIVAGVFRRASKGKITAVEKWEECGQGGDWMTYEI